MSFKPYKAFNEIRNAVVFAAKRVYTDVMLAVTGKLPDWQGYDTTPGAYTRRDGLKDLSHAYVDIFVELWRASAYLMGHLIAWAIPFLFVMWLLEIL